MPYKNPMPCWWDQQSYPGATSASVEDDHIKNTLLWRHNGHECVPNHQPHHCLLNCLFGHRLKKTSKLRVTGLCVGNSPGTGEFSAQMASNEENVSIWWRHHEKDRTLSVSWGVQDQGGADQTNRTPCLCRHGPKTFSGSWISPETSRPMP